MAQGDTLAPGAQVATIETMKMEASITTPTGGMVTHIPLTSVTQVTGGDLLVVIDPTTGQDS